MMVLALVFGWPLFLAGFAFALWRAQWGKLGDGFGPVPVRQRDIAPRTPRAARRLAEVNAALDEAA